MAGASTHRRDSSWRRFRSWLASWGCVPFGVIVLALLSLMLVFR